MAQQETFNNGADEFSYMGEMGSGPDDVSKTPSAQELAQQELDRLRSSKPSTPAAWKSYDPSDPERSGRNLPLGNSSALRRAETATEGEDNRTVVPLTRAQIAERRRAAFERRNGQKTEDDANTDSDRKVVKRRVIPADKGNYRNNASGSYASPFHARTNEQRNAEARQNYLMPDANATYEQNYLPGFSPEDLDELEADYNQLKELEAFWADHADKQKALIDKVRNGLANPGGAVAATGETADLEEEAAAAEALAAQLPAGAERVTFRERIRNAWRGFRQMVGDMWERGIMPWERNRAVGDQLREVRNGEAPSRRRGWLVPALLGLGLVTILAGSTARSKAEAPTEAPSNPNPARETIVGGGITEDTINPNASTGFSSEANKPNEVISKHKLESGEWPWLVQKRAFNAVIGDRDPQTIESMSAGVTAMNQDLDGIDDEEAKSLPIGTEVSIANLPASVASKIADFVEKDPEQALKVYGLGTPRSDNPEVRHQQALRLKGLIDLYTQNSLNL